MATIIHAHRLAVSPELRAHMARRFTFALYRFDNRISLTEVFFQEIDPSGGAGGSALTVKIRLIGKGSVVAEARAHDPYAAVAIAARRCKRAVKRALKRPIEQRRRSVHRLRKAQPGETAANFG